MKPRSWVTKCIAQIYTDKIISDAADDRENNERQGVRKSRFPWDARPGMDQGLFACNSDDAACAFSFASIALTGI